MNANHGIQRMRASRSCQSHCKRLWRLARTADAARSVKAMRGAFLILVAAFTLCSCRRAPDNPSIEARYEAKLQPVIQYVDGFIKQNGRLPTDAEFHKDADKLAWMVVLRDRNNSYASQHGAKNELDYMVGVWSSEWYYYYKSWDKQFLNASDEKL
jgi:hypothetical protein